MNRVFSDFLSPIPRVSAITARRNLTLARVAERDREVEKGFRLRSRNLAERFRPQLLEW